MSIPASQYFHYLRSRGRLAWFYRKFYLYPRLNAHLTGVVADIGCGIGDFLRCRKGAVGFDVNPDTVRYCREIGLSAELMEPQHIPVADHTFDGVVLDNVLEHLLLPDVLLQEIARITKPNGILIVGVPGEKGYRSDPDHKHFYGEADLISIGSNHGFRLRQILRLPLGLKILSKTMPQYCVYAIFVRST